MKHLTYRIVAYLDDQVVARTWPVESAEELAIVADKFQYGVEHEQFMEQLEIDEDPAEVGDEFMDAEIKRSEDAA